MLFPKNNTQLKNYEHFDHRNKKIYLANMTKELNQTFSELFEKGMRKYLRENKKIWILINTSTESLNLKKHLFSISKAFHALMNESKRLFQLKTMEIWWRS